MKFYLSITLFFLLCLNTSAFSNENGASHDHSKHNDAAHTHDDHTHDVQPMSKPATHSNSDKTIENSNSTCTQNIAVKVNGLVCDFCAQAVEKVFRKRAEVKDIEIDLSKGEIGIQLDENQTLDDKVLSKMILDSGYNVVEIERGC